MNKLAVFAAAFMLFAGAESNAQIPPELVGTYVGPTTSIGYLTMGPVSKTKRELFVNIAQTGDIEVTAISSGQTDDYMGTAIYLEPYMLLKVETGPISFVSGRLAVKGKSGKETMKGVLHLVSDGFVGSGEVKAKLKRLQ